MLNFISLLIASGIIGWLASTILRTDAEQGTLLNVVGIVFVAGLMLTPLLGIGAISGGLYSLPALIVSLLGALTLVAVGQAIRRGAVR